jgi:hypothetical protein
VIVHAPAGTIAARIPAAVGPVEAIDEETRALTTGSDSVETQAVWLGLLGADIEVTDSPELAEHLRLLAERYRRAADAGASAATGAAATGG